MYKIHCQLHIYSNISVRRVSVKLSQVSVLNNNKRICFACNIWCFYLHIPWHSSFSQPCRKRTQDTVFQRRVWKVNKTECKSSSLWSTLRQDRVVSLVWWLSVENRTTATGTMHVYKLLQVETSPFFWMQQWLAWQPERWPPQALAVNWQRTRSAAALEVDATTSGLYLPSSS